MAVCSYRMWQPGKCGAYDPFTFVRVTADAWLRISVGFCRRSRIAPRAVPLGVANGQAWKGKSAVHLHTALGGVLHLISPSA